MSESKLSEINAVYVSPQDLRKAIERLLVDLSLWPRLLMERDFYEGGDKDAIINSIKSWLHKVNDSTTSVKPTDPQGTALKVAFKIVISQAREPEKLELAAHAFAFRASALVRVIVEHIYGRSYNLQEAIGIEGNPNRPLIDCNRPTFLYAACLTNIKMNSNGLPCFDFKEFTENLRLARDFREFQERDC